MANLRYYAVLLAVSGAMVLGGCTVGVNDDCVNDGNGNDVYRPAWGTLSQETVDRLTQDFFDWNYPDRFWPLRYIVNHNDFVVFYHLVPQGWFIIEPVIIGGVAFQRFRGSLMIYLWRDGRIYWLTGNRLDIPNLYDKGILTREDLESIADAWHNKSYEWR